MQNKYHDSSDDTSFSYLWITQHDNSSNLFNISRSSVGPPVGSLYRFITVIKSVISRHHIVLNDVVHPKRYLFTCEIIVWTTFSFH